MNLDREQLMTQTLRNLRSGALATRTSRIDADIMIRIMFALVFQSGVLDAIKGTGKSANWPGPDDAQ
jgi:hypothetical protein